MADYQSILSIKVQHEYYNSFKDELAPFDIIADENTENLFRQYSILAKSKPGTVQLVVETELFNDLAALTEEFNLTFYLVSTDSVVRSITEMPNAFDIANINTEFTQSNTMKIGVENWINSSQLHEITQHDGATIYNKNLMGILSIHIPKQLFNLDKKSIILQFNTVSTYWKYYFCSLNTKSSINISGTSGIENAFTEQDNERILNQTARVFISDKSMPLMKSGAESFSLLSDKKTIIKSLPIPDANNISTLLVDGSMRLTSHIYVVCN